MSLEKGAIDELRIDRSATAKNNSLAGLGLVALVLLLVAIVSGWWFACRPKAAEVRTLVVRENPTAGQKTLLHSSGYVTARREATVSSKVTGKVIEVLVEEGMKVQAGQVLARLDDSNVKANLQLAEAQLEAARSALAETKIRLEEAQRELKRMIELVKDRISSQAELDRAEAEFYSLKARLDRQQVETTVAEKQVSLWQQQMDDTVIRAPFSGIVTSKNAQPGEMISPVSAGGGFTRTGICTIVDMDSLEIEIDVNESYINRVEAGQIVEATLDSYPDWKIPSKVIAIIPTADRQKATVKVRVAFEKLDPRILPHMGVKVAFQGGKEFQTGQKGFMLPKTAVRRKNGRDQVFILEKGRAERRAITLGSARNDEVLVLAGLAAGEKVIVDGPENLAEGDRVQEAKR